MDNVLDRKGGYKLKLSNAGTPIITDPEGLSKIVHVVHELNKTTYMVRIHCKDYYADSLKELFDQVTHFDNMTLHQAKIMRTALEAVKESCITRIKLCEETISSNPLEKGSLLGEKHISQHILSLIKNYEESYGKA